MPKPRMGIRAKRLLLLLTVLALILSGCAKKQEDELALPDEKPTPADGLNDDALDFSSDTVSKKGAELIVLDTVAYTFSDTLYGGFTYKNNGSAPAVLEEATLTFTCSSGDITHVYTPFSGADDVVMPGETACAAFFAQAEEGTVISLSAELSSAAYEGEYQPLSVSDERLIQNYPGFATLSGRLTNSGDNEVALCFVYVMFYDEADKLIGVWYFPRNAVLQPGQGTAFVVHLKSLPVEGLAQKTHSMRFKAFGVA